MEFSIIKMNFKENFSNKMKQITNQIQKIANIIKKFVTKGLKLIKILIFNNKLNKKLLKENSASIFNFLKENSTLIDRIRNFSEVLNKFSEESNINHFFELFKILIYMKSSQINKNSLKKIFSLCSKMKEIHLGSYIMQLFEGIYQTENSSNSNVIKTNYFLIQKYQINLLLHYPDNFHQAIQIFKKMNNFDINFSKKSEKIMEKLLKFSIMYNFKYFDEIFTILEELPIKPKNIFFNKIIDFISKNSFSNEKKVEKILNFLIQNKLEISVITFNTILDFYLKNKNFSKAWELFSQIGKNKDEFTYATMINGLKNSNLCNFSIIYEIYEEYRKNHKPDQIIYNCILDACITYEKFDKLDEIYKEMQNIDTITYNILIKSCSKTKKFNKGIEIFEEMKNKGLKPNLITYNSLLDISVKTGKMEYMWKFYQEMIAEKLTPDNFTYSILINGIKTKNKSEFLKIVEFFRNIKKGMHFDEIFYNSLIDTCIKFDEANLGLQIFQEMKDVRFLILFNHF